MYIFILVNDTFNSAGMYKVGVTIFEMMLSTLQIDRNTAVIMTTEYVVLKDMSCAASLVIFSCNGIKIKSYLANNEEEPFSCEFGVEDIVSIQYSWYQNVSFSFMSCSRFERYFMGSFSNLNIGTSINFTIFACHFHRLD